MCQIYHNYIVGMHIVKVGTCSFQKLVIEEKSSNLLSRCQQFASAFTFDLTILNELCYIPEKGFYFFFKMEDDKNFKIERIAAEFWKDIQNTCILTAYCTAKVSLKMLKMFFIYKKSTRGKNK